jgi:hypothetical protein
MKLLTPEENRFLDDFLHEATTAPFSGPATKALHKTGVEYGDISYLAWAYEHEVPRTGFAVGTPLTWCRRSLGRTDSPHCGGTRKSSGFGSSDNKEARSRWDRMNAIEPGTWQTKWALKVNHDEGPLGRGFGNKLATELPV